MFDRVINSLKRDENVISIVLVRRRANDIHFIGTLARSQLIDIGISYSTHHLAHHQLLGG